ncbi:anther-specific protein LAT52-like [Durio zibethinus]|uniref:Anther-specific protein LAT52-like n=1 Tax=Durio zibethinus TaxID=66656 RepID=A0A6P5Y295_DURZI|nr:anther-specific protein LAT52-like [Durio zibethinus]
MAKASVIALVSLAIYLSSLSFSDAEDTFFVEGKVYCDTCRVEFETRLSEPIKGAIVKLECRNRTIDGSITYSHEAVTDESGKYSIQAKGDHEEEICEVRVTKSPRADCNEFMESWNKARVVLTKKDGILDPRRFANGLGFLKKEAVPGCAEVLKEMGFLPLNSRKTL